MSMKILLDPILTAQPSKCSTNIQFLTFVERTLARRDDVFFYWMIPDHLDEARRAVYPQHPHVRYLPVTQAKDRTREYLTFDKEHDQVLAFNGDYWDFDVLLTVRTGLVPLAKLVMTSPRGVGQRWLKEVWVIDEMPLMDFKKTVACMDPEVQDLFTLAGYVAADRVYCLSYHEPPAIVQRARDFFAPSQVRALAAKLRPVCTTQFTDFHLKAPEHLFDKDGDKPFCIAHSGRMEMANGITAINDLMVKQFVMKGAKVRLLVTTVSDVIKAFDQSVVEVKQAGREEFWQLCKEEMHVFLKLSIEGGFSLALLEPMMFGVPAIINRADWSEALLGKDYPFFVSSETQAYALVQMFHQDYPGMYAKWSWWHLNVFRPLFQKRFETDLLYDLLAAEIDRYDGEVLARFRDKFPGKAANGTVATLLEAIGDGTDVVIPDLIKELGAKGVFTRLAEKLEEGDRDRRGLVWSTPWNEFRVILKAFHGWVDASPVVGHLRRAS